MSIMKKGSLSLLVASLLVVGASCSRVNTQAGSQTDAATAEIPRYLEPAPGIGTGGQPSDRGFRLLADRGYKAIINLRTPDEGVDLAAEKKLVEALGMKYVGIPVVGSDPRDEQAEEFLKVMEELRGQNVFVHCASANRVGAFVMIDRVLQQGVAPEAAEKEADQVGLRSEVLRRFSLGYIERHKKEH